MPVIGARDVVTVALTPLRGWIERQLDGQAAARQRLGLALNSRHLPQQVSVIG